VDTPYPKHVELGQYLLSKTAICAHAFVVVGTACATSKFKFTALLLHHDLLAIITVPNVSVIALLGIASTDGIVLVAISYSVSSTGSTSTILLSTLPSS
jgi:hypothetical protein